jgi:hypothetical protein
MKSIKNLTYIWSWGCHDVYLDADLGRVTKVPNIVIRNFMWEPKIHTENLWIARQYLGSYLLDSQIYPDERTGYREEREYVKNMRFLLFTDLDNKEIARQFYDILKKNKQMYRENARSLDIFWLEGIFLSMIQDVQYFEKDNTMLRLRIAGYKALAWLLTSLFHENKDELATVGFSNSIIEDDTPQKRLKITDSTLTYIHSDNPFYLLFSYMVNHGNNIAMRRVFWRDMID